MWLYLYNKCYKARGILVGGIFNTLARHKMGLFRLLLVKKVAYTCVVVVDNKDGTMALLAKEDEHDTFTLTVKGICLPS